MKGMLWLGLGLASLTAISYVLIDVGVLAVGDAQGPSLIPFIAAGCYMIGGLLIPARRAGLWLAGVIVNAMILLVLSGSVQPAPVYDRERPGKPVDGISGAPRPS
jgi:hypothetical protein